MTYLIALTVTLALNFTVLGGMVFCALSADMVRVIVMDRDSWFY